MHRPASKCAVITGASSGIGVAFARRLAAEAYDLVLIARRQEWLTSLATDVRQRFHVGAEVLVADLSKLDDVAQVEQRIARGVIETIVSAHGQLRQSSETPQQTLSKRGYAGLVERSVHRDHTINSLL